MAYKHLFLLRHARTLERSGDELDINRELSSIGLQNSTRMGMNFLKHKYQFDQIISSPARRALVTSGLIAEQLKIDTASIFINEDIYEASTRTLMNVVNHLKDSWKRVLIVGHNPAISYLGEYLSDAEIGAMTTCGVLYIKFDINSWAQVSEGNGQMISYEHPDLLNF